MGSLNTHLRELGPTPKSFDAALPASSLVLSSPARRSHVCACDCCCLASPPLRSRSAGRPSRSRWTACSSCAAAGAKALEPFQFATPMVSGAAGAEPGGTHHAHPPNFPRRSPTLFLCASWSLAALTRPRLTFLSHATSGHRCSGVRREAVAGRLEDALDPLVERKKSPARPHCH